MDVISIVSQKGGTGKSTTAHAIGAGLFLRGKRVLHIDLDSQGNLSYSMGADTSGVTAMEVLQKQNTVHEAIQSIAEQGDIMPSSPALAAADTLLTHTGKEYRLKEALQPLKGKYDYIIVDTSPSLGVLTVNALAASTGAIIPAQADVFSLQGINRLYDIIDAVKTYCNPALHVMGIVLSRYSSRAILSRELAEMIEATAERFQTRLFNTRIRECVALREAQAMRQSIYQYSPRSNAAKDYTSLVDEIVGYACGQ